MSRSGRGEDSVDISLHLGGRTTGSLIPDLLTGAGGGAAAMEHWLGHRPEVSPQWRCEVLLAVRTGEEVLSLLDVRPGSFEELAETLDATAKAGIASRTNRALSWGEWAERGR